jgi:twitching motility protein PilT
MLSESHPQSVISQTLLKKVGGGLASRPEIMIGTPAIRNLIRIEGQGGADVFVYQTGGALGVCRPWTLV